MNNTTHKLSLKLQDEYQIKIQQPQNWQDHEWGKLYSHITMLANILGGRKNFIRHLGEVAIERTDTGTSLGLAYHGRIKLNANTTFSAWSLIHELAHVWDAKHEWKLSQLLEKYTGGSTNPALAAIKKIVPGQWDAGMGGAENKPGRYGRKPGCNAHGYFYRDKPSGSNWRFNRKEDFAESVVMYCGWTYENELTPTAHGRIERYLLPNGTKDPLYGITDNWSDYAAFFYPEQGDYSKTRRWKFIHELIQDKIQVK